MYLPTVSSCSLESGASTYGFHSSKLMSIYAELWLEMFVIFLTQYEDEMLPIPGQTLSRKSAFEMLQEERKTLPIYSYRDQLLKAIEDHQVLVIVGDTGSEENIVQV